LHPLAWSIIFCNWLTLIWQWIEGTAIRTDGTKSLYGSLRGLYPWCLVLPLRVMMTMTELVGVILVEEGDIAVGDVLAMTSPTRGMDLVVTTPGVEEVLTDGFHWANPNGLDDVKMVATHSLACLTFLIFLSLRGTKMHPSSRCRLVVTWMSFFRSLVFIMWRPFLELVLMRLAFATGQLYLPLAFFSPSGKMIL